MGNKVWHGQKKSIPNGGNGSKGETGLINRSLPFFRLICSSTWAQNKINAVFTPSLFRYLFCTLNVYFEVIFRIPKSTRPLIVSPCVYVSTLKSVIWHGYI